TQSLAPPGAARLTPAALGIHLDPAKVRDLLARTVPLYLGLDPTQAAVDAGLQVRDHQVEIQPARAGTGVDLDALAADVAARFAATEPAQRTATVSVGPRGPRVS